MFTLSDAYDDSLVLRKTAILCSRENGDTRGDLETVKCSALLIVKLDVPLLERE